MSYTALYRKYRPSRFSDVCGQEHIVRTLQNQIINEKVSHAYMFCGTRGTGKTSLAKILAKAINCLAPVNGEPCGVCETCAEIEGERSPNVIEIDAASNNGVDSIRDIREEVRYTPTSGRFKVYIIDEVHMLSVNADNALLKTLEEPPAHVIFILATTDPQKIPATIHSRCQRYDFRRIPSTLIADRLLEYLRLERHEADAAAAEYIARISDGSMRDALSLLDRCISFFEGERITREKVLEITGSMDTRDFLELTRNLNDMDANRALHAVERMVRDGRDINRIIAEAISHFRDLLIAKSTGNSDTLLDISKEASEALKEQSRSMDEARLIAYIRAFSELQANARYSPDSRVLLEIELIKLCNPEILNKSYEELSGKVARLEKRLAEGVSVISRDKDEAPRKPPEREKPKKRVALPEDFYELRQRFGEVKGKLSEQRQNHFFAAVIERTDIGFLDDKAVYVVFDDETNENILKNDDKKLELLNRVVEQVTGKSYIIKTITRERFEREKSGLEFENPQKDEGERLLSSVKDMIGEFCEEE